MKIYPSEYAVAETKQLTVEQIPLAFIDNDYNTGKIHVWREECAAAAKNAERVWPFAVFDRPDPLLFSSSGIPVDAELQRQGLSYLYVPQGAVEFSPLRFTADVLVKKKLTYKTEALYNIRAGASADSLEEISGLMPLFGDAARRGLCPENVSINDKDMQASSLIDKNISDCDVLFVQTADGVNIIAGGESSPIDYDSLLENNLIVWAYTDSTALLDTGGGAYSLASGVLFKEKDFLTDGYDCVANEAAALIQFPTGRIIRLFIGPSPVVVIEKAGKGFVIVSGKGLLKPEHGKLAYEILMQIYLSGYHRTTPRQLWVTDETVDEVIGDEIVFGRRHPQFNIDEQLVNDDCVIDSYNLVAVNVSRNDLYISSIDRMNNGFFEKNSSAPKDPLRPAGMKSAYDNSGSVLYYKDEAIQKIETGIPVIGGNEAGVFYADVGPCSSSSLRLHLTERQRFFLAEDGPYIVSADNGVLSFVLASDYEETQSGVKLATVSIMRSEEAAHLDIRIPGGGLPEHLSDDYNMMDISSHKGRPLRKGSTCIIRLPQEMSPHDALIREAVELHKATGSHVAIIYE